MAEFPKSGPSQTWRERSYDDLMLAHEKQEKV